MRTIINPTIGILSNRNQAVAETLLRIEKI